MRLINLMINPDKAELIVKGLKAKQEKFGKPYCPCRVDNTEESICPCNEVITKGKCHCGMFERTE